MHDQWNEGVIHYKGDVDMLQQAGFTTTEIIQLSQLRSYIQRNRAEREECITAEEYHRLEFIRWLVKTGRLSN